MVRRSDAFLGGVSGLVAGLLAVWIAQAIGHDLPAWGVALAASWASAGVVYGRGLARR